MGTISDVSFHVNSLEDAIRLAKKYNQVFVYDWKTANDIPTGVSDSKNGQSLSGNWDILLPFQEKYPTKTDKENALKQMTEDRIKELVNAAFSVQAKIFYNSFLK